MTTRADFFTGHPERIAALSAECASWIGTPFRKRSCVKGQLGGVDCAGYVGAVFAGIGAIDQAVAVPPYELNHAEHSEESLLRSWFERPEVRARVRLLDEDEPAADGDLVFPKVGRTEHHLGIQVGREVYHVSRPAGVVRQTIAGLKLSGVPMHRSRYRLLDR